jgi:hypothetical protein
MLGEAAEWVVNVRAAGGPAVRGTGGVSETSAGRGLLQGKDVQQVRLVRVMQAPAAVPGVGRHPSPAGVSGELPHPVTGE